jgi:hypothetical protein
MNPKGENAFKSLLFLILHVNPVIEVMTKFKGQLAEHAKL